MWDNNKNRDFHSGVEAAATDSSMVEMVFQAMKREAADADLAAEDRAASRAMRAVSTRQRNQWTARHGPVCVCGPSRFGIWPYRISSCAQRPVLFMHRKLMCRRIANYCMMYVCG